MRRFNGIQGRLVIGTVLIVFLLTGALLLVSQARASCTAGPDVECTGDNSGVYITNTPPGDGSVTNSGDIDVIDNEPGGDGTVNNSGNADTIVNAPGGDGTVNNSGDADTIVNAPDGDGTLNNSGDAFAIINAPGGDGTLNNSGDAFVIVNAPDGDGTLNNSGDAFAIVGDAGGDSTINNSGNSEIIDNSACGDATVNHSGTTGEIDNETCTGTATVIISGTVSGDVNNSGAANNQVVLQDGAVVTGTIDGGGVDDTLVFSMTVDEANYDQVAQQLASQSPTGGSININGQVYHWANFTELRNLLKKLLYCVKDQRINGCDSKQTMAGYCKADGGLSLWEVNESKGTATLDVSKAQIADAIAKAKSTHQNVLIVSKDGRELWALSSGQLQMHDSRPHELHGAPYDFIFEGSRCG